MRLESILSAAAVLAACLVGVAIHGWATAVVAERFGDRTPRLHGRRALRLRAHADPLGTYILPGLYTLAAAFAALRGIPIVPFAYGKPHELGPSHARASKAQVITVALAGPVATLALALIAGMISRWQPGCSVLRAALHSAVYVWTTMTVIELVPLPGRDGGRILQLFLPPRGQMKMQELTESGPAFVILFLVLLGFLAARMVYTVVFPILGLVYCLP